MLQFNRQGGGIVHLLESAVTAVEEFSGGINSQPVTLVHLTGGGAIKVDAPLNEVIGRLGAGAGADRVNQPLPGAVLTDASGTLVTPGPSEVLSTLDGTIVGDPSVLAEGTVLRGEGGRRLVVSARQFDRGTNLNRDPNFTGRGSFDARQDPNRGSFQGDGRNPNLDPNFGLRGTHDGQRDPNARR